MLAIARIARRYGTIDTVMPRKNNSIVTDSITVEESSGNVFADIGLPDPEERLAKADIAIRATEAIRALRLSRTQAARTLNIDKLMISRILRGQLCGLSTERLAYLLTLLR